MGTHRVYARSPRFKTKPKDKKQKAYSWIQKQRQNDATWTSFKFDIQRAGRCYNLPEGICSAIFCEYREGKPGTNNVNLVPKDPNNIRQDVLATFLLFKYNLSLEDFILAKKLATLRNRGRSNLNSDVEQMKWPARPDIFAKCPTAVPNAISDEELADYFVNEKYIVCHESDGSETEDGEAFLESVPNSAEVREISHQSSVAEAGVQELMGSTGTSFQSVEKPQSNATVDLLDMRIKCLTHGLPQRA